MPVHNGSIPLSSQELDALLADLVIDHEVHPRAALAVAESGKSPKREIPKKGNDRAGNPPNFGYPPFPLLGSSDAAIMVEKGNTKANHHGRDLEKDKSVLRQLVKYRPEFWARDSSDPSRRFRLRTTPIGGGGTSLCPNTPKPSKPSKATAPTDTSVSTPNASTATNTKRTSPTSGTSARKTPEQHAKVRPSTWSDTTPVLKGIAATMALQEGRQELTVFRMTPHRKMAAEIRAGSIAAHGQSPADYIRRRIVRHVAKVVGRTVDGLKPEAIVLTQVSPEGVFHTHALVTRQNTPKLRKALRLAGFEWEEHRQFQLGDVTSKGITPGWVYYAMRDLGKDLSHMSMSRTLQQKARSFYETFRAQQLASRRNIASQN